MQVTKQQNSYRMGWPHKCSRGVFSVVSYLSEAKDFVDPGADDEVVEDEDGDGVGPKKKSFESSLLQKLRS